MEDDRVDDASDAGPRSGNASCEGLLGAEIGGDNGDGGDEEAAGAKANAEALREDDLPVGGAEGGHHHAEDDEEGAGEDEGAEVACVVEGTGFDADGEEQEGLEGANPGDVG